MFTRTVIRNVSRIGRRFIQTPSSSSAQFDTKVMNIGGIFLKPNNTPHQLECNDKLFEYRFAALNINNGNLIPPSIQPPAPNQRIEEPGKDERKNIDTPVSTIVNEIMEKINDIKGDMDLPPLEGQNDSYEAAVMVEIRRLKMKKHKRKKLLKKMKFVFAKRRLRRKLKKEK